MVNYDGLYNKDFFGDKLKPKNHFVERKIHFKIIEDATILPHKNLPDSSGLGGIVDSKGNFIEESFIHHGTTEIYTPYEKVENVSEPVIYFGMLVNIWGHCLTDNIKRLWFFFSNSYQRYFKKYPIVYVPMWYGIIPNFAKLLEVMGFNVNNLRPITKPTKFPLVIMPDASLFPDGGGGLSYTNEYVETIERARNFAQKNFSSLDKKKFYFFHGRNQIGEERIAQYLETKGYETIHPERLPLEEQLNILANCESFASNVGSIAHNTLFVKDGTETLLIPRTSGGALNNYQHAINQIRNLNVSYVDSFMPVCSEGNGPYCYIVSENLRKHFGDEITEKYTEDDLKIFLAYIRYAKSKNIAENKNEIEYLRNVLPEFIAQLKTREDLMQQFGIVIK